MRAAGLDFNDSYSRQADLRGVDSRRANLEGASLNNAQISGAYFPPELSPEEIILPSPTAPACSTGSNLYIHRAQVTQAKKSFAGRGGGPSSCRCWAGSSNLSLPTASHQLYSVIRDMEHLTCELIVPNLEPPGSKRSIRHG